MGTTRRRFLKAGGLAALVLAVGGGVYRLARGPAVPGRFVLDGEARAVIDAIVPAGGAINTPGLLLRSAAPNPHGLLGARTFLHPTVISAAIFRQRVDGDAGAPQTIYSDHFLDIQPIVGA